MKAKKLLKGFEKSVIHQVTHRMNLGEQEATLPSVKQLRKAFKLFAKNLTEFMGSSVPTFANELQNNSHKQDWFLLGSKISSAAAAAIETGHVLQCLNDNMEIGEIYNGLLQKLVRYRQGEREMPIGNASPICERIFFYDNVFEYLPEPNRAPFKPVARAFGELSGE